MFESLAANIVAGILSLVTIVTVTTVTQHELQQKAQLLLKAGAIDLPTFVELVNPPMVEALRTKSKKLAENKAKQSERVLAIQEAKANRPSRR